MTGSDMFDPMPNILSQRYASSAMTAIWSPHQKVILERRLWIAVMRAQRRLGVAIPERVIDDYEAVVEMVDLGSIARREAVTRHDVKARIDEFCSLAGHEQIHRGMTSRDLTENVEQMQIRDALRLVRDRLVAVLARVADLAEGNTGLVMVARTHNVAAQATTLGKRFADVAEETMTGLDRLETLIARYPMRGIKGPVGTRLDQLDLLGGASAVDEFEREIADHLGFDRLLESVGQIYPRSLDLDVVSALVQAVCGPANSAITIRLMAGNELVTEGFRPGQVGSSAMPHKMNARSAERVGALRTVLDGYLTMAAGLAGRQWNEGDVSCSVVRRVMLPDSFMAAEGLLQTALGVFDNLAVFPEMVSAELRRDLPFLATTRILAASVEAGLGREEAHELVRQHATDAVLARREGKGDGGFVERIVADSRIPLDRARLEEMLAEPIGFTGTADQQVASVVARVREIVDRYPGAADTTAEVRV